MKKPKNTNPIVKKSASLSQLEGRVQDNNDGQQSYSAVPFSNNRNEPQRLLKCSLLQPDNPRSREEILSEGERHRAEFADRTVKLNE